MRILILILAMMTASAGYSMAGCKPKDDEQTCKHPENVYTASVDGQPVKYIGNDGKEHKCTVGHCKGKVYNGCSGSADLCCDKE